jgi:hypothetical protein
MTAEKAEELSNDLRKFRQECIDSGWEIYWNRIATEAFIESAKKDRFIGEILTQIIQELDKLPRREKPTLTMTRPLFEAVFKGVFALFKDRPLKPFFMGTEVNVVEDEKMWWTLGKKYDVEKEEQDNGR